MVLKSSPCRSGAASYSSRRHSSLPPPRPRRSSVVAIHRILPSKAGSRWCRSSERRAMVDVRTPGDDGPQPRLRLRFALYTGVVLLGVGLAVTWLVNREVENRAARTVENQARAVALTNLRRQLRVADFAAPVSPARRAALDKLFRQNIILPGVVGGGLVSPGGTVTYSARHE